MLFQLCQRWRLYSRWLLDPSFPFPLPDELEPLVPLLDFEPLELLLDPPLPFPLPDELEPLVPLLDFEPFDDFEPLVLLDELLDGPEGPEGPEGLDGPEGPDLDDGLEGPEGPDGFDGLEIQ